MSPKQTPQRFKPYTPETALKQKRTCRVQKKETARMNLSNIKFRQGKVNTLALGEQQVSSCSTKFRH